FTKPESIGCWISACTSVVSPVTVARTRMVDAIGVVPLPMFTHDPVGKPLDALRRRGPSGPDHARVQPPQPPTVTLTSLVAENSFPEDSTIAVTLQVFAIFRRLATAGTVPAGIA